MRFFVGLDLGQVHDYSALVIIEKVVQRTTELRIREVGTNPPVKQSYEHIIEDVRYAAKHVERCALDLPYPRIVEAVLQRLRHPALKGRTQLIVDGTGVGRAPIDLFRAAGLKPPVLLPITITGGNTVTRADDGYWHVPKRDLISVAQVLLQQRRLTAVNTPVTSTLLEELRNYRVKISDAGHDRYNAREGAHDDLVLALCLACWAAERYKEVPRPPSSFSYRQIW